jgi:tape measure domain-containing protein
VSGSVDFGIRVSLDGGQQAVQQTDELARNFGALERVAQRFGAALGTVVGTVATRAFVQMADSVTVLKNRLTLATGSIQQAEAAYGALFQIAQRSRQSFTELGGTFASISRATQELGISQGRLLRVTEAIGNAIAISGGSAASAQAALIQLSQGFASGTLRGEELNSVMEQTPRLAKAIADGLGVSVGKLRELGQEGKLSSAAVLGALEAQSRVLSSEVQNSSTTVAQASQVAQNSLTSLVGEIDRVTGVSGFMAGAIIAASEALTDITQALRGVESAEKSASVVGSAISVVFETITVLGADVSFVLKGIGREIGGLAAQAVAIATGEFAQARAIRKEMVADAEKARAEIDAFEQRVLRARQLRELAQQALEGVDTRAEDARLSRQGKQQRLVGQATKATAEELRAAAQEAKKQQQVLNELVGATDDFTESARRLQVMRQRGILTEQQYDQALSRLLQRQPAVIAAERQAADAAQDRIEARRAEQRAIDEAIRSWEREREASLQSVRKRVSQLEQEAEAVELSRSRNISLAQAIEEVAIARLREQQARYTEGSEPYLAIEKEIEARQRLLQLIGQKEAREASTKAAEDAARAWQSTADDIRGALTDAFRRAFESGESFGKAFGQVIEREIKARLASALAGLVTNGIIQIVGGALVGASAGGSGGRSSAGNLLQGASLGKDAYNLYNGSSLYATAGNYAAVYSGSAYGTAFGSQQSAMLAAQEAGMVSQAGASSMATWGSYAGWAALIALGISKGMSDWRDGFRRDQARDVSQTFWGGGGFLGDIQPMGGIEASKANFLSQLGFSDKWADLLSGATAVAKIFGRAAPRITAQGVQGSIVGGDFSGELFADVLEKGGIFRSDKRYQKVAALPEELGRLLDQGAGKVFEQAKKFGEALGLPAEQLAGVTTALRVEFAKPENDSKEAIAAAAQKNLEAVAEALSTYGDDLVKAWAEAVKPLAEYGETAAQTIQRVGGAILQVNDVLGSLGLTALQASVDGGKAALALQQAFGGMDNLRGAAGSYLQSFYSDTERRDLTLKGIGEALGEVNLAVPATRDAFRQLVEAQDLTTESGRKAFAVLLGVADAFAAVTDAGRSAAQIAQEAQQIQLDTWREMGNEQAIRDFERSKVAPENLRAYDELVLLRAQKAEAERLAQQQADAAKLRAQEDEQRLAAARAASAAWESAQSAAMEAAAAAARAWGDVRTKIEEEIRRLRGIGTAGATDAASLASQFAVATAQARAGDVDAAGRLPELSKALSEAYSSEATSREALSLFNARLAASLERTNIAIGGGPVGTSTDVLGALAEIARQQRRTADILEQFDVDGMPQVRT